MITILNSSKLVAMTHSNIAHQRTPSAQPTTPNAETSTSHRDSWNNIYLEKEQRWSGKPNPTLVDLIGDRQPTNVLDLGSGEGGDVIWLAQQGWTATGIDLSDVAVERATAAAQKAGVQATFIAADLTDWGTEQSFDLIVSSFLQSHFTDLDRVGIFKQALELLTVGGELIAISHAGLPSFVKDDDPRLQSQHFLPVPADEARVLTEQDRRFTVIRADEVTRQVTSLDGETGTIADGVLVIRRVS